MSAFIDPVRFCRSIVRTTFKPRPSLRIWQWIDRHVSIPVITGSPNPGPLKTSLFPVYRPLYEALQLPYVHKFTFCASARVGKTLLSLSYMLWRIAEKPGPMLWLDPTRKTAMRFVRQELEPFIRECAPVWNKAIVSRTTWTALEKQFRGLQLRIVGSGSPADLAGYQAESIFINEADRLRSTVEDGEAASADLAVERSKQFEHTRMILRNSTPTREDGDIWRNFRHGSQLYCYVRCPHCEHLQRLTFWSEQKEVPFDENGLPLKTEKKRVETTGRVKFDQFRKMIRTETEPGVWKETEGPFDIEAVRESATYECAGCKKDIEHAEINGMMADAGAKCTQVFADLAFLVGTGTAGNVWQTFNRLMAECGSSCIWLAHNLKAQKDHFSAHLSALYSPFERWGQIAVKFLEAKGDISKLCGFYTLDLGIPFVHGTSVVTETDVDRCIARCPKPYLRRQLPFKPEIISLGVDVQGDGFYFTVTAHGILFDLPGAPSVSALIDLGRAVSWEEIEEISALRPQYDGTFNRYKWRDEKTGEITEYGVTAGLIDSGFEALEGKKIYEFCLKHSNFFSPSKGGDESKIRGGTVRHSPVFDDRLTLCWYWDDYWKQTLYQHCIKSGLDGAGEPLYFWMPADLQPEYRAMFCNERIEQKNDRRVWVTKGDNHIADCVKLSLVLGSAIEVTLEKIRNDVLEAQEAKQHASKSSA